MRLTDVMFDLFVVSLPTLLAMIALRDRASRDSQGAASLAQFPGAFFASASSGWPGLARSGYARQGAALRGERDIEAARSIGVKNHHNHLRHLLPNS